MAAKKEKEKEKAASVLKLFADPSVPVARKQQILTMLLQDQGDEAKGAVQAIFEALVGSQADETCVEKAKQLSEMLELMEQGPQRYATFLMMLQPNGSNGASLCQRAHVVLEDGTETSTLVPDAELAKTLRRGDSVLLDAQGRALLYRLPLAYSTGESALLERRIGVKRIEVKVRGDEKYVFHASQDLIDKLDATQVVLGCLVLVNSRQRIAFDAIPSANGLSHYKFLTREKVPNVIVERHIACPPAYIKELENHIRTEMTNPELRRRYGLPRCAMRMLCGISGGGKTLSILGFWRRMYEVMSEV